MASAFGKMASGAWSKKQTSALTDGVLVRSANHFYEALQRMPSSASSDHVREIRRGLRAMERELERRGLSLGDRVPGEAPRDGHAPSPKPLPREGASSRKGAAPHENGTPRKKGTPEKEIAEPARGPLAENGGEGPDVQSASATPAGEAPLFRLIPQLRGTSSKVVAVLSEEGIIRYQSEPIKWLLGYDADQLVGEALEAFARISSKVPLRESIARMKGGEKFDCWHVEFRTASGEGLWREGMASNFLDDPRLGGILVYWRELVGAS